MAQFTIDDKLTTVDTSGWADVSIEDFTIYGFKSASEGRAAQVMNLVTGAEIIRTIDGAPTLSVDLLDPARTLSEHDFLSYRITMVTDTFAYELAKVVKKGDTFSLTFEEVLVAEMRRRTTTRKVAALQMSRVEFGYLLLSELPNIDFVTPPIDLQVTNVELARGKDKVTPGTPLEDTYKALTRIFGAVFWRFWIDKGQVFAAPDTYLLSLPPAATLIEYRNGVDEINYDIDAGKPVAKAEVTVLSERWALPIGARVNVAGPGPQEGGWIVSEIRRSLFSKVATVTLLRGRNPLPEPPSQPSATDPQATADQTVAGRKPGQLIIGKADTMVAFALSKEGGRYVWGGTGPNDFDCSGLVQAAAGVAGVSLPRISWQQFNYCADGGGEITVEEAAMTRGAILERSPSVRGDSGHIAISLGTGDSTIEAMGSAYGIRKGKIQGRLFNHGARVPGLTY